MSALPWIGAIFAVGVLIIVHESGHYFVAKWCKMYVDRFSVGFGPALFGWRRGETYFQVAPIPFGGFAEIRGINVVDEDFDADDPHAFPNRPVWQRFLTIFAGPATNWLFAVLMGIALFMIAGKEVDTSWYVVAEVHAGFDAEGKLRAGDRIVAMQRPGADTPEPLYYSKNGFLEAPIESIVSGSEGRPILIVVERSGKHIELSITPTRDTTLEEPRYRMGVLLRYRYARERVGIVEAVQTSLALPIRITKATIGHLYERLKKKQQPDVSGPVRIAEEISGAIKTGWIEVVNILIFINVALALFNLFPLPALDGGRLAFLVYEMATRRRPNPKIESTVHMVGIMALLILMVLVTYKDCARLF